MIKKISAIIFLIFLMAGCNSSGEKGVTEKTDSVTVAKSNKSATIASDNFIFKEVSDLTKNSDYNLNNKVQSLDIDYHLLAFKIRYISDRAYISVENEKNILLDWQPIQLNFYYDLSFETAEKDIHLLVSNNDIAECYLLFPAFTEQYATYFLYRFEKDSLTYVGSYEATDFMKRAGLFSFNEKSKRLYHSSTDTVLALTKIDETHHVIFTNVKEDLELLKEHTNKSLSNTHVFSKDYEQWVGNYTGRFLRLKDESADPRAWATIKIQIKKETAKFQLDSYVENIKKEIIILKSDVDEITLAEKNNPDVTFAITRNKNKHLLSSQFMDKTIGEKWVYELTKD